VPYSRPEPLGAGHEYEGFTSGDQELDTWLVRYARHAEGAGSARTFVTSEDGSRVIGYYALTVGEVGAADGTERLLKGQPGGRSVPVVILARMAVDREQQGRGVGSSLLQDALLRTAAVAREVGVRALVVHAATEAAGGFYERFGFEPSPTDQRHLVLLIKDLKRFLDERA
jgi:GNAT superfamily N-acetyltransferase